MHLSPEDKHEDPGFTVTTYYYDHIRIRKQNTSTQIILLLSTFLLFVNHGKACLRSIDIV